jgi:hypothetical protein
VATVARPKDSSANPLSVGYRLPGRVSAAQDTELCPADADAILRALGASVADICDPEPAT